MITVIRIGKHLGAEISGVDLSQPLDDDTFAQVAKAFFENEVVFFRNQKLTPEQQIAFTRRFGVLEQHVRKEHRLAGYPGNPDRLQRAGRARQGDRRRRTPAASGTAISPTSASRACSPRSTRSKCRSRTASCWATPTSRAPPRPTTRCPEDMKQRLQDLKNVHSYRYYREKNIAGAEGRAGARRARGAGARADRGAARERARTSRRRSCARTRSPGRKGCSSTRRTPSHIVGLPKAESDALLAELCAHIIKPEFRYEHHWQAGDLLMWDNAAVQHKANFDYDLPLRRLMYRTTVRGPPSPESAR